MRIGVVYSGVRSTIGGGFTFQQSIISALEKVASQHQFVVLDMGDGLHDPDSWVPRINLKTQYHQSIPAPRQTVAGRFLGMIRRYFPEGIKTPLRPSYYGLKRLTARIRSVWRGKQPLPPDDLTNAVKDFDLDLLWFLSPYHWCTPCVPFIFTVWDLQHRLQPYFPEVSVEGFQWGGRESMYRAMIPKAALTVTGTSEGRNEVIHFYAPNPNNVRVIPFPTPEYVNSAVDGRDEDVMARYNMQPGYLFYPAQFWPHKNHVTILLAVSLLKLREDMDIEVVFVGSDQGNQTHIRELIEQLDVKAHMLGFVPIETMAALYRQAKALVFASFFGPDNLPPLEAFAFGCPVVAANVPGSEEQLGEAALFFDPADEESLAETIHKLVSDQTTRKKLIENGYKRQESLTTTRYLSEICQYLDEFAKIHRCWR